MVARAHVLQWVDNFQREYKQRPKWTFLSARILKIVKRENYPRNGKRLLLLFFFVLFFFVCSNVNNEIKSFRSLRQRKCNERRKLRLENWNCNQDFLYCRHRYDDELERTKSVVPSASIKVEHRMCIQAINRTTIFSWWFSTFILIIHRGLESHECTHIDSIIISINEDLLTLVGCFFLLLFLLFIEWCSHRRRLLEED